MFSSVSELETSFHESEPVCPLGSFSSILSAVLIAVMMITGTDPIRPAKKKYLKMGKKYLITKSTHHCNPVIWANQSTEPAAGLTIQDGFLLVRQSVDPRPAGTGRVTENQILHIDSWPACAGLQDPRKSLFILYETLTPSLCPCG
jgi:hypothetical protein